ncbi:MAG: hypothetical protein HXY20_02700 [Acidobacteria bacterium]|nr:hypothetical protein [Acidobacteriota bacterium]
MALNAVIPCGRLPAQEASPYGVPQVSGDFGVIPDKFGPHEVILGPDKDEADWWAGAPSVVRDAKGVFWLACRMRTAEGPRGRRGYEIRILRSEDGRHFRRIHSIRREDVPIPGFERPSILLDPSTGRFKLYGCGPWKDGPWVILKFDDAADPGAFVPSTARPVIMPTPGPDPRSPTVEGYKDPVIFFADGKFHCFVIGVMRNIERTYHFTSADGEQWDPVGHRNESVMSLSGWHDFFVRPASVLPLGPGYLFVYEGSSVTWSDPVYQIATGLAFTFDLHHILDLTPQSPLAVSTTPSRDFRTWRYSHWMHVGDEVWAYAEVEKPNGAHEIRLFRLRR